MCNDKSDITNSLDIVLSCLEEFSFFFENSLKAGLNITKVTRHLDSLKYSEGARGGMVLLFYIKYLKIFQNLSLSTDCFK